MVLPALLAHPVLSRLAPLVDKTPAANDVKAGWLAFWIFIALGVGVALLGVSLTRHLRRVESNRADGIFGDSPDRIAERMGRRGDGDETSSSGSSSAAGPAGDARRHGA